MAETPGVQSVERALTLMELIAAEPDGLRLSEVARRAGLAASTTHRLLTTLEQRGFLHSDAASGHWHVGRAAHRVGAAYVLARNLVAPALPFLRRLRDATRETANLGLIEDGEVVTLSQVESREIMRAISPPGGRVPVLCSGMGKAILATRPDREVARLVQRHGFRAATARSLTRMDAVEAEMAQIRARGYAVDDEEFVLGLRCVAAVVWGPSGDPACAISVSGLAARMTPEKVARCGETVQRIATELSQAMGAVQSPSSGKS
ncbi:IclR family transcriptional regulator [Pseudooceanicola sp. CBS1P-1]|uniref:Helix-turn-helix domain-containing protein n=1 Tax=Pseudooceanicola albus TaxID=2692189 RepID=A0A6L7FYE6_9RHOB|nr:MULTISPECIES: IclR family transcriptional regulator [Pseudooceanicola]MBT9383888.1 IclR family transcriptional regulator [Pseudooceanicola endophyticus]MXN16699.1 helix-turn-helix domain-containing protein [Pseudooceanicola albus]